MGIDYDKFPGVGKAASWVRSKIEGLRGSAATATEPGIKNPNVAAGGSPEAQAYRAGEKTMDAKFAAARRVRQPLTGLRGAAALGGRLAGPLGAAVAEGPALVENLAGGENPIKSVGRAALRGGATMLGGGAGAALGTLAGPAGTLAGGVAGGAVGYKAGDAASEYLFGPDPSKGQGLRAAPTVAQPQPQPAAPAPQAPEAPRSDLIDTLRGARVTPQQLIAGTDVPVEGQGAVRRTTPGNESPGAKVGGSQPAPAAPGTLRSSIPQVQGVGLYKFKADTTNARNALEARNQDVTMRGQDLTSESNLAARRLEGAKLDHTLGKENEDRVNAQIEQHAKSKLKPLSVGGFSSSATAKAEYDASAAQEIAATKNRFQYSVANRQDGKTLQSLRPAELQQLRELDKIHDRVNSSRTGFQTLRDLIGQKRFDSEDLYSYAPARDAKGKVQPAEKSVQGGYVVKMANGNTIHVADAVSADGQGLFVLFGSNKPVDADTMGIIRPAIEAAKRGK